MINNRMNDLGVEKVIIGCSKMKVSLNTVKQLIDFELPPTDELVTRTLSLVASKKLLILQINTKTR